MRRLAVISVLLGGLLWATSCATTVHQNVPPVADDVVVLAEPPKDSGLPPPGSSYAEVRVGLTVETERSRGQMFSVVRTVDQAAATEREPLDLDILIRVDGAADAAVVDIDLARIVSPANMPDGTGAVWRYHRLDYRRKVPQTTITELGVAVPGQSQVTGEAYVEYSIAGRYWEVGKPWYTLVRVRTRFVSAHPDWIVMDSRVHVELPYGITMGIPVFQRGK